MIKCMSQVWAERFVGCAKSIILELSINRHLDRQAKVTHELKKLMEFRKKEEKRMYINRRFCSLLVWNKLMEHKQRTPHPTVSLRYNGGMIVLACEEDEHVGCLQIVNTNTRLILFLGICQKIIFELFHTGEVAAVEAALVLLVVFVPMFMLQPGLFVITCPLLMLQRGGNKIVTFSGQGVKTYKNPNLVFVLVVC